jgi:hypothetical protein
MRSRRTKSRTAAGRKRFYGLQPEPAADFFHRDIVTRLCASQIQFGCSLCVDDFLFTELRKEGNSHLYLSFWKGINERVEMIAIG